jgi:FkbM family methyltransferase
MQSPYLIEHRHMAMKRCKHGLFMYNRNDAFVGRGLDLYGEWCEFEINLLRLFIRPGDIVIDAGANIGTHTVAFANMVGPTGVVHAFEPQRRNFLMLAGNVAINGLDNVFCHQSAVGDTLGQIRLPPLPPADTNFNSPRSRSREARTRAKACRWSRSIPSTCRRAGCSRSTPRAWSHRC